MNDTLNLIARARQKWERDGFASFAISGAEFLFRDLWLEYIIQRQSLTRSEMKAIATEKGKIWNLKKEKCFELGLPKHSKLSDKFDEYPTKFDPAPPFVCTIPNCNIVGQYAIGITKDGEIITETVSLPEEQLPGNATEYLDSHQQYLQLAGVHSDRFIDSEFNQVFRLITSHKSYYHWIVEELPKIRMLEHYRARSGEDPTLLVESDPRDFVKQTLSATGYEPEQYREWKGGTSAVDDLIIPIHRSYMFDHNDSPQSYHSPSREELTWLRKRVRSKIEWDQRSEDRSRIYISRQKTKSNHTHGRKVMNYNEIESILDDFGFSPYTLEDLCFEKQVKLFADADIIMGPHGAGLVNMIFSDNPKVVELFPENVLRPHFYLLSRIMEFDHSAILTEQKEGDLFIDQKSLRARLRQILH